MIAPTETQLLSMYRQMLRIRLFEEEVLKGETVGLAIHSCAGQEAVAVGISSQLRDKDLVVSNHRPWGHFLAKGGTIAESFAEILGRPEGVSHGIGGEMGISKKEIGFVQSTMIVGACMTLACGVAFSIKNLEVSENIAVVYFGEGASTNGAFNEAMTLAKVFELPLLFICENNGLSGNTPASEFLPTELVSQRAMGYGIPVNVCDGSDVLAVWEAAQKAIEYVRQKGTPYFLECLVARINRHKVPRMPDIRPPEIKQVARMRDPILKLRAALEAERIMSPEQESEYRREVFLEIGEALEKVRVSR